MQFALLIYESQEAFATRNNEEIDPYTDAWQAYYKALVAAGVYVGGDPLKAPETGTTVRLKEGKRRVQDGDWSSRGPGSETVPPPKAELIFSSSPVEIDSLRPSPLIEALSGQASPPRR